MSSEAKDQRMIKKMTWLPIEIAGSKTDFGFNILIKLPRGKCVVIGGNAYNLTDLKQVFEKYENLALKMLKEDWLKKHRESCP